MHKRINVGAVTLGAIWLASCVVAYSQYAYASRNSSGSYSTPNTFTAGSVISSSAMNANFSDLATEMTDSLDRSGKGGMLAALRGIDGTVAAPALSFTNESGSGLYRIGSNNIGFAINGSKRQDWTTTGTTVTGTLSVTGVTTLTGAATLTGGVTGSLTVDQAGANTASSLTSGLKFGGTSSTEGIASNRSGIGANTNGLDLITGGTTRLQVASGGGVTIVGATTAAGGLTVGSSGTATTQMNFGNCTLNGGSPATCTATVASGAKCVGSVVGTAGAVLGVMVSVTSTTLTLTSGNGVTNVANYICF